MIWQNAAVYLYFLLALFFIGLTAWGVFDIRFSYFIKTFNQSFDRHNKQIAITFDDGPHPITEKILDLLLQYDVKVTFFCIGQQIEQYPEIFKRIISEGHIIGNHSYSHTNKMGFLSSKEIVNEIVKTNEIAESFLHKKIKLYRPPFGITNPHIAKAVRQTGMHNIGWSIRSLDTVMSNEYKIFKRVQNKVKPGSIILLHDTSYKSVEVLERLLLFLQSEGYQLVTVDKLLKISAYVE